jgi:predicted enzyme related to lactoylglutathione lyase
MIQYKAIGFVAYPVTRMARARKFYEDVLGLKSNGFASGKNPKWIEYDIGTGTLGIGSSETWKPSKDGVSAALEVEDFEGVVAYLKKRKIKFVLGPMDFPSCRSVAIRDPDGNKLSLHQRKPRRGK